MSPLPTLVALQQITDLRLPSRGGGWGPTLAWLVVLGGAAFSAWFVFQAHRAEDRQDRRVETALACGALVFFQPEWFLDWGVPAHPMLFTAIGGSRLLIGLVGCAVALSALAHQRRTTPDAVRARPFAAGVLSAVHALLGAVLVWGGVSHLA